MSLFSWGRIKPNTLVYCKDECPGFIRGEVVLLLGYLNGHLEGHGIFARYNGNVVWGYHVEDHFACVSDELMDNAKWDRKNPRLWIVKVQ